MNEEKEIKALLPTWRQMMLTTHTALTSAVAVVWTPVTWLCEQFNGTADLRYHLNKMERKDRQTKKSA